MSTSVQERIAHARGLKARGELRAAATALEELVRDHPRFADVHNLLGLVWHELGDFERAAQAFRNALEINPHYTEAALHLAVVANDVGRYTEARQVFERALEGSSGRALDPILSARVANLYAEIGDAFAAAGVFDRATDAFRQALELHPSFHDIRRRLAQTLLDAGDPAAAVGELERVVEAQPTSTPAKVALGLAMLSAGRRDEAVSLWRQVLERDPNDKRALMYLRLAGVAP